MIKDLPAADAMALRELGRTLFKNSINIIDSEFVPGYAMRNPTLLVALVGAQIELYLSTANKK